MQAPLRRVSLFVALAAPLLAFLALPAPSAQAAEVLLSVVHRTATGTVGTQNLAVSGTGRYVRMYGTRRATAYGYSPREFQVYGTAGGPGGNLAVGGDRPGPTDAGTPFPAKRHVDHVRVHQ
ncbi:hypothetical protein ACIQOF_18180 [Streptomyces sp. NPDC091265]|uniref:hypothetical protein n=1 Tax=Streptomyces sp. NPDC091265 TaxID=3365977 RepID=UPI0037F81EDD